MITCRMCGRRVAEVVSASCDYADIDGFKADVSVEFTGKSACCERTMSSATVRTSGMLEYKSGGDPQCAHVWIEYGISAIEYEAEPPVASFGVEVECMVCEAHGGCHIAVPRPALEPL